MNTENPCPQQGNRKAGMNRRSTNRAILAEYRAALPEILAGRDPLGPPPDNFQQQIASERLYRKRLAEFGGNDGC